MQRFIWTYANKSGTSGHRNIYILYVHIDKVGPLSVNTHISCCVNDTELTPAHVSSIRCSTGPSEEDGKTLGEIKEKIKTRPNAFFEMEAFLPKKNGWWRLFTRKKQKRKHKLVSLLCLRYIRMGSIVYNMCKYYDCLILQIVPASGSWKCECDSSQQAVKVSNGHQNKRLVCYVKPHVWFHTIYQPVPL